MSRFLETLQSGPVLLMDGAMGSQLRGAGLSDDARGEEWNLTHSGEVRSIHQAYKEAGAQCFLTNTFQSNPGALAKHGLGDRMDAINRTAVQIARSVAGPEGFVLGDVGPMSPPWQEQPIRQVVSSLRGVDGILLETFSDLDALWAVRYGCLPVVESPGIPLLLSITYKKTPEGTLTTHGGQTPEVYGRLAKQYGVAALGVNCGLDIGMSEMTEIVRRYRTVTDLPLFARPNAGTPVQGQGQYAYPNTPNAMAARLPELLEVGVAMIGGCCGTTPHHISAFKPIVDSWNAQIAPGEYI